MKNVLFSFTLGIVVGYVLRKMDEQGQLDHLCDKANELFHKTKRDVKNLVDTGINELEYIEDRIDNATD